MEDDPFPFLGVTNSVLFSRANWLAVSGRVNITKLYDRIISLFSIRKQIYNFTMVDDVLASYVSWKKISFSKNVSSEAGPSPK